MQFLKSFRIIFANGFSQVYSSVSWLSHLIFGVQAVKTKCSFTQQQRKHNNDSRRVEKEAERKAGKRQKWKRAANSS